MAKYVIWLNFFRVCFRMSYKSRTLAWFLIDPEMYN